MDQVAAIDKDKSFFSAPPYSISHKSIKQPNLTAKMVHSLWAETNMVPAEIGWRMS